MNDLYSHKLICIVTEFEDKYNMYTNNKVHVQKQIIFSNQEEKFNYIFERCKHY